MAKPRVTYAELRRMLLDLGITETVVPRSQVFFAHQRPGAEVALPIYRPNRLVMPHHLIAVRITLDATGLMDRADFEDFAASTSMKQSAS